MNSKKISHRRLCGAFLLWATAASLAWAALSLTETRFDELTLKVPRGWIVKKESEVLQARADPGGEEAPALGFYRFAYTPGYAARTAVEAVLGNMAHARGTIEPAGELPAERGSRFKILYTGAGGRRMKGAAVVESRLDEHAMLVTIVTAPESGFAEIDGDGLARTIALSVSKSGSSKRSSAGAHAPASRPAEAVPEPDAVKDRAVLTMNHTALTRPGFPAGEMIGTWVEGTGVSFNSTFQSYVDNEVLIKETSRMGSGKVLRLNEDHSYILTTLHQVASTVCNSHTSGQEHGTWSSDGTSLTMTPREWQNSVSLCEDKPTFKKGKNPPRSYRLSSATLVESNFGARGPERMNRGLVLDGPCFANFDVDCRAGSLDPNGKPSSPTLTLQRRKG